MRTLVTLALTFALGTACSSAPKQPGSAGGNVPKGERAAIEITYAQGDNFRHLTIHDSGTGVVARNFLNRKLVVEAKIDRDKFKELLQKASALVNEIAARAVNNPEANAPQQETLEGPPAETGTCHSPFTVTVRTGKTSQSASGCKSNPEGASFSRFTREAEFFLFSKK